MSFDKVSPARECHNSIGVSVIDEEIVASLATSANTLTTGNSGTGYEEIKCMFFRYIIKVRRDEATPSDATVTFAAQRDPKQIFQGTVPATYGGTSMAPSATFSVNSHEATMYMAFAVRNSYEEVIRYAADLSYNVDGTTTATNSVVATWTGLNTNDTVRGYACVPGSPAYRAAVRALGA